MAWLSSALLVAAVLFPPILFIIALTHRPNKRNNSPPSPPGLPIIGNLHQLGLRPHRTLQALTARHGPLMLLHLGPTPVLVVSSEDTARAVLRTNDLAFSGRPPIAAARRLFYGCRDLSFADYGDYWRQARRVCVLHLLSARRVRASRAIREQEVALLVDRLKQQAVDSKAKPGAVEVDLSKVIIQLTNDITCRVALGKKYPSNHEDGTGGAGAGLKELLEEFLLLLGTFNVADYIPGLAWLNKINGFNARMDKNAGELDRILDKVLDDHIARAKERGSSAEADGDRDDMDFVDVLLSLLEESRSESSTMDGAGGGISLDGASVKAIVLVQILLHNQQL